MLAKLHAPLPSQLPPHFACFPAQALRGSCPAATGTQVPALPAALQVTQLPAHSPAQQTPSTQWPLWQSAAPVHGVPFACSGPSPGVASRPPSRRASRPPSRAATQRRAALSQSGRPGS